MWGRCNLAPLALLGVGVHVGYHGFGLRPPPFARLSRAVGAAFGEPSEASSAAAKFRNSEIQKYRTERLPNAELGGWKRRSSGALGVGVCGGANHRLRAPPLAYGYRQRRAAARWWSRAPPLDHISTLEC